MTEFFVDFVQQLFEAIARLMRVATLCDCEQLERMTNTITATAYEYEQEVKTEQRLRLAKEKANAASPSP